MHPPAHERRASPRPTGPTQRDRVRTAAACAGNGQWASFGGACWRGFRARDDDRRVARQPPAAMPAARHRLGLDCKVNDAFEPVVADGELPEAQGVDGGVQLAHGLEGLAQRANDDANDEGCDVRI